MSANPIAEILKQHISNMTDIRKESMGSLNKMSALAASALTSYMTLKELSTQISDIIDPQLNDDK